MSKLGGWITAGAVGAFLAFVVWRAQQGREPMPAPHPGASATASQENAPGAQPKTARRGPALALDEARLRQGISAVERELREALSKPKAHPDSASVGPAVPADSPTNQAASDSANAPASPDYYALLAFGPGATEAQKLAVRAEFEHLSSSSTTGGTATGGAATGGAATGGAATGGAATGGTALLQIGSALLGARVPLDAADLTPLLGNAPLTGDAASLAQSIELHALVEYAQSAAAAQSRLDALLARGEQLLTTRLRSDAALDHADYALARGVLRGSPRRLSPERRAHLAHLHATLQARPRPLTPWVQAARLEALATGALMRAPASALVQEQIANEARELLELLARAPGEPRSEANWRALCTSLRALRLSNDVLFDAPTDRTP